MGTCKAGTSKHVASLATTRSRRGCNHDEEGVCDVHGRGAVLKWKPNYKMTRGKNGKTYKKYEKLWYYACDLSLDGGAKLTQPRLSFSKMTQNDRKSGGGGVLVTIHQERAVLVRVQWGRI